MYGYGANRMNYNGTVLVTARSLKLVDDPLINQQVGEFNNTKRT